MQIHSLYTVTQENQRNHQARTHQTMLGLRSRLSHTDIQRHVAKDRASGHERVEREAYSGVPIERHCNMIGFFNVQDEKEMKDTERRGTLSGLDRPTTTAVSSHPLAL